MIPLCCNLFRRAYSILIRPAAAGIVFSPPKIFCAVLRQSGQTNYLGTARQFLEEYPQRGLVIVISDFLEDGDCLRPLQYLADFGHELLFIQLWGEEDRMPTGQGEMELTDAETGAELKIALDEASRQSYTEAFDMYAGDLRKLAIRNGGRYAGISTGIPLEEAVFGPLMMVQGN